jgi:SAM-dependent methyltransferase
VTFDEWAGRHWRALDTAPDAPGLLAFLDEISALPAVGAAKRRSFALLDPRPGDRLLDAGCGTGTDAIALARTVLPGGEVIGVDSSAVAIATARARAGDRLAVRFERADVTALPFSAACFTAVRADRVLLHVGRPVLAVHELVRVTRPGGRVVITEGRLTGIEWLPGREPPPHERGDVLAALPLILEHLGAHDIEVERVDSDIELSIDALAVIGVRGNTARLSLVHITGTIGGGKA